MSDIASGRYKIASAEDAHRALQFRMDKVSQERQRLFELWNELASAAVKAEAQTPTPSDQ